MITLYAIGFNITKFYTIRTECGYAFCTVLKIATIVLYSIALLIFINETKRLLWGIIIIIIIISNLSNGRSKASSKTIPPHSAI